MPFLVAAAVAVLVGIGAVVTQPWSGSDDDEVPQLTAAEQVLQAPDAEEVFLDLGAAGRATVVRSKAEDKAVITTEDMVSAPEGKAYELWLFEGETPRSAMCAVPASDGSVFGFSDASLEDVRLMAVTVESNACPSAPTTEPVFTAEVTA